MAPAAPPVQIPAVAAVAEPAVALAVTTPGFKRPPTLTDLDLGLARQTDNHPRVKNQPPEDYITEPPKRSWTSWLALGGLFGMGGGLLAWLLI